MKFDKKIHEVYGDSLVGILRKPFQSLETETKIEKTAPQKMSQTFSKFLSYENKVGTYDIYSCKRL